MRDIESAFGESVRSRYQSIERRDAWKSEGRSASFAGGRLLWGDGGKDPSQLRIAMTSVTAADGRLVYSLDADGRDAVCAVSLDDLSETRLKHGSERRLRFLSASPDGALIACSVGNADGSASIALMKADASDLLEVTEGDSVDLAPTWASGRSDLLVYQTAGIGRDSAGVPRGLGPFSIHRLDLKRGEMSTLWESESHDFLGPRLAADGTLYAIRRPCAGAATRPAWRVLLDILLIPLRILWAIFQYLNFFTTRYTGKPLTTAGGPERQAADIRQMMIWGNLVDAEQAARESARHPGEPPSIVPRSWELVARRADGSTSTIARAVVSFDLAKDGSIVWTTGSAVVLRSPDGKTQTLAEGQAIEQVVVID